MGLPMAVKKRRSYDGENNPSYLHGHSSRGEMSKEYMIWASMKQRCNNKNNSGYSNYGGRGIKVCKRWETSFSNFISDMGKKPTTNHSIERVDNNKGYSPDNCVWATRKQQSRNKRTRVDEVVFNGETQTEASLRLTNGEGRRIVDKRIKELGWDIERAFTTLKRGCLSK